MERISKDNLFIGFLTALASFANAMIFTQFMTFLIDTGISSNDRSFILILGAIFGIIFQVVIGYLADKYKKMRLPMIVIQILLQIFVVLTYRGENINLLYFIVIASLMNGFHRLVQEFLEAWIYSLGGPYNIYRSLSSLGWALGALALNRILSDYGYGIIASVTSLITLILVFLFLYIKNPEITDENKSLEIKEVGILIKNKNYFLLLLVYFWFYIMMTLEGITIIELIHSIDYTKKVIGYKFAFAAFVEIPVFLISSKIVKKFKYKWILYVSIILQGLRFILYSKAELPISFLIIGLTSGLIFPLQNFLQHKLSDDFSPENLKASAQMVMTGFNTNIPSLFVPFMASYLTNMFSIRTFVFICGMSAFIPLIGVHKMRDNS